MSALSFLGIASIPRLNVQYAPEPTGHNLYVSYSLRNASAELIEAEATSRLEGVLSSLRGCTEIESVSRKGSGTILLSFRKNTDMDAARFEAASAIRNIYPSLPKGITYPEIRMEDDSEHDYAVSYNLKGQLPPSEIDRYAREHLLPSLSAVKGVDDVMLSGSTPYQWVITFDALKADAVGISGEMIAEAFRNSYSDAVVGMVDVDEGRLAVRLAGSGSADFGDIPVTNADGTVLHLRDLATWRYEESLPDSYYRVNGLNTITIAVSVARTENMLTTVSSVKKEMARLKAVFPKGISANVAYDASEYVRKELGKIFLRTGLCILILLLFVFLINRSWRYLLIVAATLVVNILSAIAIYAFAGLPIHVYTLAGITVSLGIVIDTSIVMADHYGYWKDRRVFPAIVSATATTVGALLMVLLLPERLRADLTDFIWVIIINLALSLVVAYLFVPSLMTYLPAGKTGIAHAGGRRLVYANERYRQYIQWGVSHKWLLLFVFIVGFGLPTCLIPVPPAKDSESSSTAGANNVLERIASWKPYATNRRKLDKWLSSSFGLFNEALNRSNLYRRPQRKQIYIRPGMPEGATVGQLNEVVKSMENYLAGFEEIESFTTSIYRYDDALLVVEFKPEYEQTSFTLRLKDKLKAMASDFGGANWAIYGIDNNGFNNNTRSSYLSNGISLQGYNFQSLYHYAELLVDYLSTNKRVTDLTLSSSRGFGDLPGTEFNLSYDFGAMSAARVNPYAYYGQLSSRLYDRELGRMSYEGIFTPVVLRSSETDSFDLWHILNAPMAVDSTEITLSEVGSITKKATGIDIWRKNQSYRIDVCFNFVGASGLVKQTLKDAIGHMNESVLPVGYKAVEDEGSYGLDQERYAWLILLIVIVIFVMLSMAFESLRYPFAVIFMIPISFIGLFLTFGLSDFAFDQGGFAALVMLCGIVVNAGIYLVTTYQRFGGSVRLTKERQIRRFVKAFNHKIVPISLTIASTVFGLLPFLSDGPEEVFWFDFAIGTIGGLFFSVIALLFYLPVFVIDTGRKSTLFKHDPSKSHRG